MSWRAVAASTASTLEVMSDLRSDMATDRVFFMSAATARRSLRLSAGGDRVPEG